ncbi:DUF1308 domain-containing protein [Baaleninema simplex]|uniref:DUF1308 domain-containing protein n=1 Tax=Baaleninema simplex TaxID=2862350 RepID=UPI0008FC1684|nr:DUF1308 domain-containing protein [Baaleninema simplex]
MINLDTCAAIALIGEGSPVRYTLRQYIQEKPMVLTQTALREFRAILETVGGESEKRRGENLLQRVNIVPDRPSARALRLKPTRRIGENDIIILGTGDCLGAVTLTSDSKAVKAALAQGVRFQVYLHPPYPLTGS